MDAAMRAVSLSDAVQSASARQVDADRARLTTVEPGCGVKPPHGKHSSGQLCRRKDGSVALQWVTSTKTDVLSKVPRTPDGRDICWANWCHMGAACGAEAPKVEPDAAASATAAPAEDNCSWRASPRQTAAHRDR